MNTRTAFVLILAAALSASALSAASNSFSAIAYSVNTVTSASGGYEKVSLGATSGAVARVLGSPALEISPDTWVYHNYHADLDLANDQGCDTMVISFAQGKVVNMKLVNHTAALFIAANVKVRSAGIIAAAK
jgi:predicted secreted hydrolase